MSDEEVSSKRTIQKRTSIQRSFKIKKQKKTQFGCKLEKMDDREGFIIYDVEKGKLAHRYGIKNGDLLIKAECNGEAVKLDQSFVQYFTEVTCIQLTIEAKKYRDAVLAKRAAWGRMSPYHLLHSLKGYPSYVDDWNGNGVFVFGYNDYDYYEFWKLNFATQIWTRLDVPFVVLRFLKKLNPQESKMIKLKHGQLLFAGVDEKDKNFKLYVYDVVNCRLRYLLKFVRSSSNDERFVDILIYAGGNQIIFSKQYDCYRKKLPSVRKRAVLYSLDTVRKTCRKVARIPETIEDSMRCALVHFYNDKIWLFKRSLYTGEMFTVVHCYGLKSKCWSSYPVNIYGIEKLPPDLKLFDIYCTGDSIYVSGGTLFMQGLCKSSIAIWRLYLPTLMWTKLSKDIPCERSADYHKVINVSHDHQLLIYVYDMLHRINLSEQPRRLQNICWDKIIDVRRSRSLSSYTNDELYDFKIPKKFRRAIFM